ncbi:succinylglutamate desuccinylase/aspartoacylase family protein [Flagellimonas allohymeniacidonis]|nr:succinylglutamate desuccinylase/aspartoacylase family protein [Allomuricauda hymeniacidonis]
MDSLKPSYFESGNIHKVWLKLGEDGFSNPIKVPVLIAKGVEEGQVFGLTAAIHGNELNGIPIIYNLMDSLDVSKLKGTVVAIPGLNPLAIANTQREYVDQQDLNRLFPGKAEGNRSQQMAHQIGKKIIPLFDYHIDLHTASFGRVNSLYGRGDMQDDTLANMLRILQPDIIVSNKGKASFGEATAQTLRAFAISKGVHSITMEYGNPQVFQQEMIKRGTEGILRVLTWLKFTDGEVEVLEAKNICSKSYWVFTQNGGYLKVLVDLNQMLAKGDTIAILTDSFGKIIEEYKAPEAGIVVGKSTNPISVSGSRIIHLGILAKRP